MTIANRATPDDVAHWKAGHRHKPGEMNRGEKAYASHLEELKRAGKLRLYQFEPPKLRLALRTFYTPDFRIVTASGKVEYHEVKGRTSKRRKDGTRYDTYYAREDAVLKVKLAADKYRDAAFFLTWPARGGGWSYERVRSAEGKV
jgi:hypothetical protein